MENEKELKIENQFDLICPECGVGNLNGAKNCLVCGKNLEDTIIFLEDDSFDLEITKDAIIEYRKNFWGTNRTGKVNKYNLNKVENVEFGPSSRFIFSYNEKRIVLPLKEENLKKIKKIEEVLNL
ncbi:hypothetical protein [Methanobacterium sp.]|jgi:hypothetical protein|uniref:hypothetical protein n=1 Tax=Methanobacterium sp. TaxID=2164 RepID=UPI00315825DB